MYLGSHVSFGKNQLLGSVKEALSYNANTFMFYTGAPQNTIRSEIDDNNTKEALELMKSNNIDINKVICHAPYIINLANKKDPSKWDFSINFLKNEIKRCEMMNVKYIVVHPGSSVGITPKEGLDNIIDALNIIIDDKDTCMILLETMAGKGNECGRTLEEIKYILDGVKSSNIGVCIDTCHLNDAGYDISDANKLINDINNIIGLERVKCVHLNDSKNEIASHKDRHDNIGFGTIGFNNLINLVYNAVFKDIPIILETPYIGDTDDDKNRLYPPYKYEINMIKNKEFDSSIKDKIRKEYK